MTNRTVYRQRKVIKWLLLLLVIVLLSAALNPSKQVHHKYLTGKGNLTEADVSEFNETYHYRNYVFFSTTTHSSTGKRETIGVFGFVFK